MVLLDKVSFVRRLGEQLHVFLFLFLALLLQRNGRIPALVIAEEILRAKEMLSCFFVNEIIG